MAKKVILGPKPQPDRLAKADEWVNGNSPTDTLSSQTADQESRPSTEITAETTLGTVSVATSGLGLEAATDNPIMKRLTIDVPESLHAQIKSSCALKGVKMTDEIRTLLEAHFLASDKAA